MFYRHTYAVVGSGPFPIDMLRYDGSYPESESPDSAAITQSQSWGPKPPPLTDPQALAFAGRKVRQSHDGADARSTPCAWVVTLVHDSAERRWAPTAGRWESFCWYVVPDSITTVKR